MLVEFKIISFIVLLVIGLSFLLMLAGIISILIHVGFFIDDLINKR